MDKNRKGKEKGKEFTGQSSSPHLVFFSSSATATTCSQMKRKQPARRSSRLASKSGIKQPKGLLERQTLKQQIHQTSLSDSASCSSVAPSQLRMVKKSRRAKEGNIHIWTDEEDQFLLNLADQIAETQSFQANKSKFYSRLADLMNSYFIQENNQYVPLTATKVRTKLSQYQTSWLAQGPGPKEMITSSGTRLTGCEALFTKLFSANEATSSDPVSGTPSVSKKRKFTTPIDLTTSLKYLAEHGSTGIEYYIFTAALSDETTLTGFIAMDSYQNRRKHLIGLWKQGIVNAPAVKNIPPEHLPPDFQ